jgi:hypothetical protein
MVRQAPSFAGACRNPFNAGHNELIASVTTREFDLENPILSVVAGKLEFGGTPTRAGDGPPNSTLPESTDKIGSSQVGKIIHI